MNKRSGITLVEVLVSITIFLSVFMGIISTFYLAEKRIARQEEYQYIENLCLDIDKIYDTEGYSGLVSRCKFKEVIDVKDETSKSTTINECKSDDYTRESDGTPLIFEGDQIGEAEITDGNEENTKTKTYTVSITKTSYYISYDKNIETTTTNYSASIIEDSIYLDSNYQMVDGNLSYKYEITYSYSRKYSETKEVTSEKTIYEIGTIEGTREITETWVKSSSGQESNTTSDDNPLDGYEKDEGQTNKEDPDYTGNEESFDSNPNKTDENKITTITTRVLDTSSVNLTISIKNVLNDYYVISDLEYGNSKYDVDYFKNYENKEVTINGEK